MHCALLQAGELQAIVGDASRDGLGGTQYCGLWSLTSRHRPFNAFGNSYAGLIPGLIRGKAPRLEDAGDTHCVLVRDPDEEYPVEARAVYRLTAPHFVDHELEFVDHRDMREEGCAFREASWCSGCPVAPKVGSKVRTMSGSKARTASRTTASGSPAANAR